MTMAIGAPVLGESDDMRSQKVERIASRHPSPEEMEAYGSHDFFFA
jgi:hypothetical protein